MTIPAAKVKSLCTSAEIELVRASRKPQLDELSPAELKRLAARARKLHDKWRDTKRSQARHKSRVAGLGKPADNTKLKAQIFREALESFEDRLQKLTSSNSAKSAAKPAAKSPAKSKPKTKAKRAVDHRHRRAAVRKGLAVVKDLFNEGAGNAPLSTMKPTAAEPAAVAPALPPSGGESTAAPPAKARSVRKPAAVKMSAPRAARVNSAEQLQAVTAAKQARVVRSGRTTRMLGHTQARGKRNQARRDARN
ncbi:MAG: hypothetical protein K2Y37_18925 [Pirellulales bacterium]|nr:hypothetical protein [Pirellulales bacterium]